MRIAILDKSKCTREICGYQCIKVCPPVKMGDDAIVIGEDGYPIISEILCTGCGLCPKRCPVDAIKIINTVEEHGTPIHSYGVNSFRLYGFLLPKERSVVGVIGVNGIGKSTSLAILRGALKPNLGKFGSGSSWEEIQSQFRGQEAFAFLKKIEKKEFRISYKPQYVDKIAEINATAMELMKETGGREEERKYFIEALQLRECVDRKLSQLSGGELQRVAVACCMIKEAEAYFFDEPLSFLDVGQRLRVVKEIRKLALQKNVIVVEHDLAMLDYLSDYTHVLYGQRGAYGVVSHLKGARNGINEFLEGYLKEENLRFRNSSIRFGITAPSSGKAKALFTYSGLRKKFEGFELEAEGGEVREGEVIGVMGSNGIGKSTFIKMLAGMETPDEGKGFAKKVEVAYKPQYLKSDFQGTVQELMDSFNSLDAGILSECKTSLSMRETMDKPIPTLSYGELQVVSCAIALSRKCDLRLFDEPAAFLDVEQRLELAALLKKASRTQGIPCMVVDHDVLFIDLCSNRLLYFDGVPGKKGKAHSPTEMREGMNAFLKEMKITFRRDPETGRPRANKTDSVIDKEQKQAGEYYYYEAK